MDGPYVLSPLVRIVDVHFGEPKPGPPRSQAGTISFNAPGANSFTLPGEDFTLPSFWNSETGDYGTVINHSPNTDHAALLGSHATVAGSFLCGIMGGTQDGTPLGAGDDLQMDAYMVMTDGLGHTLFDVGPAHAEWAGHLQVPFDIDEGFAIPAGGIDVYIHYRAVKMAGLVVLGFASSGPGLITISVSV